MVAPPRPRPREDTLKAVIQERKMERIAAEGSGGERREPLQYRRPYSYPASIPPLPAPTGYMPTAPAYWQNPLNVVYAMSQVYTNPGQEYQWADLAKSTYTYLSKLPQNFGVEPEQWTWAGENDPLMLQLGSYEPPPLEYQNPNIGGSAIEALYSAIYPIQRTPSAVTQAQTANVALPEWQQWYEGFTSNPYAQAALQALPVFVISTLAGTAAVGPVGGLAAGIGSIIAMGATASGVQSGFFRETFGDTVGGGIDKAWNKYMELVNALAVGAEQFGGTASYVLAALQEEDIRRGASTGIFPKYPGVDPETVEAIRSGKLDLTVPKTAEEWKALWDANRLFYEVEAGEGGLLGAGWANIFPGIERVTDALGWTEPDTIPQLANYGEVLRLGVPGVTKLEERYVGLAAINYFRNELLKGNKSPEQILSDARQIYGASGEMSDLMNQTLFDPAWILVPGVTKGAIGKYAKFTGNKYLSEALKHTQLSEGAIGTFRHYQDLLRGVPVSKR